MDLTTTLISFLNQNILLTGIIGLLVILIYLNPRVGKDEPPLVPYTIPFVGSAIEYGMDPIKFMKKNQELYGDCFTFIMMGRKMTFCLGPEGNHFVFNIPIANASAEGVYEKLTVPVFGKEVVYDVPNPVFMEQKKFVKDSFSSAAFESYVDKIWNETISFFNETTSYENFNVFMEMSELTIRTASNCLMGSEVRSKLHSDIAKLYLDLDAGFAPIALFFKWLPLPVYIKRDRAHNKITNLFKSFLEERRTTGKKGTFDIMEALMNAEYRNGQKLSDDAIAHLMIALLMGGQHTSSTTSSWMLFELARRPDIIKRLREEQSQVLTGKPDTPMKDLPKFDYDQLRKMTFLDCVMKETLRLHAPIHTIMRLVEKDVNFNGYRIPKGHFLCGSQQFSQLDPARFSNEYKFEPERFIDSTEGNGEWTINGVNIAQKSAKSHFLPFGAGRHRCIGEAFAYLQVKTIIALFLRKYDHHLVQGKFPKPDYTSLIVVPEKPTFLTLVDHNQ